MTIAGGKMYSEMKYRGAAEAEWSMWQLLRRERDLQARRKAKVNLKLTDSAGKPFVGSTVVAIYDKSVEYISGGSNVEDIKVFF